MFKVGDRVRYIKNLNGNPKKMLIGMTGRVIELYKGSDNLCMVEYDCEIGGHSNDGFGKERSCWWMKNEELELENKTESNIRKQAEAIADLIEKKEKDYDSAFSKSYKEFGMTSVAIRLSDKVERLKNLVKGEEPNFESIDDTLMDIAGYAILALAERKEN